MPYSSQIRKLLRNGKLAFYYAIGIVGLIDDDIILTSFPKSGNTWVRFFLCNIISIREWDREVVTFPKLDDTMPELGVSNLVKHWKYNAIPRVVKTHKKRWPIFKNNDSVLIVRDPRDVMVSYYHSEKSKVGGTYSGNFSDFIRHPDFGIGAWCDHFTSWKPHAEIVLEYEEMKKKRCKVLQSNVERAEYIY
jgi:hypothetical protein